MTLNDLKIDGLPPNHLTNIDIAEATHRHGSCDLLFTLPANFDPTTIRQWNKTKVTVKTEGNAQDEIIFCGLVSFCKLEERPEGKFLFVRVLTLSCQMESAFKSKSYQSPKKKLSDVVNDVKTPYADAQFDLSKDAEYPSLIYRDNLTDWDFFKRFAEHLGQVLFVNSKTDKLWLSVGYKAFAKFKCDKEKTKLLRQVLPMDFYKRLEQNTYEGARSLYFLETDLVTPELKIGVGSEVEYDGQKLAVIASRIYVDGVNLFNEIKLRAPEGCRADAWDVMKQFDEFYYIGGKVLESKDNDVKVQFDCDTEQIKEDALEIPFEAGTNNYLYNMPDEGETVCVYVDYFWEIALLTLRTKKLDDKADYKNRSLKVKDSSLVFDPEKFSFAVGVDKTEMKHEDGTSIKTDQTITFEAKGDIYIQSALGLMPDNQLMIVAPYLAGYGLYLVRTGQSPKAMFSTEASTLGKNDASIKNAGAEAQAVELSELADELDKITGRENAKAEEKPADNGGTGGKMNLEGTKSAFVQVEKSSLEIADSNLNVKTCVLFQIAYIPSAGGGTGSLKKFEGGNPGKISVTINVEQSVADRERVKEQIPPTDDIKTISVG